MTNFTRLYKMDIWTDLNSGADWAMDLLDQPNGLFGDLKEVSHHKGDMDLACKPRAVEQMTYSSGSEEPLGLDWMESGDLGSFLDALNNGQDRLLPQEDSLFDCSQEIGLKENVSVISGQRKLPPSVNSSDLDVFYQGLTPPESPEQVTPIIKLDPEIDENLWAAKTQNVLTSHNFTVIPECNPATELQSGVFLEDSVNLKSSPIDFLDQTDLIGVSSDFFGLTFSTAPVFELELLEPKEESCVSDITCSSDGSRIVSPSESPSPRPSIDSLIQSSPELYKVIATPTDLSSRYSPYSKTKGDPKVKDGLKTPKAETVKPAPISEDLFPSNMGKKDRKKLQNKNAAIRYRQKKKVEVELIVNEVQGLEERNSELKSKVDDLQREVKYMKSLMEDIYRAKGLVK